MYVSPTHLPLVKTSHMAKSSTNGGGKALFLSEGHRRDGEYSGQMPQLLKFYFHIHTFENFFEVLKGL